MVQICLECIVFRKTKSGFEFLLLKRLPEKGDFWQPITGSPEKSDKSLLDGMYREIFEETGIPKSKVIRVIKNVHSFLLTKHYLTDKKIAEIKEVVYAFEVEEGLRVDINKDPEKDHSGFRWVSFDDSMRMLKWDDNKTAFMKLYASIKDKTK